MSEGQTTPEDDPALPPRLRINLFGPVEALVDGAPVSLTPTQQAIVACLILEPALSRERLEDLFWPLAGPDELGEVRDTDRDRGNNLSVLLREIGTKVKRPFRRRMDPVQLDLRNVEVDLYLFDAAVKRGLDGDRVGLEDAHLLHRAPLLSGLSREAFEQREPESKIRSEPGRGEASGSRAASAPPYGQPKVRPGRGDLEDLFERERGLRLSDWDAVLDELATPLESAPATLDRALEFRRKAFRLHPSSDANARALVRLLLRMARFSEARQVFKEHCKHLEDLEQDPSKSLLALISGAEANSPGGKAELPEPEERPGRTVGRGEAPHPASSTVGRDDDLERVNRCLEECRLVTILGEPGMGKTHLVIRLAERLRRRYGTNLDYFEIGGFTRADEIAAAMACGVVSGELPAADPERVLERHYRASDALLILDNCESHIATCRQLVERLLRSSARLQIVVTSREALGLEGERRCRLKPLRLPPRSASLDDLRRHDASRLFLERAEARDVAFAPADAPFIAGLCHRLWGLPLAIELAAVWAVSGSLRRLDRDIRRSWMKALRRPEVHPGSFDPHRSLTAALDASWLRLSGEEQRLLCYAALFPGGMPRAAADRFFADGKAASESECVGEERAAELLYALVSKSLLVIQDRAEGADRFTLLEAIRDYCQDRASGECGIGLNAAYAAYYAQLLQDAHWAALGPQELAVQAHLDTERDNIRAAYQRAEPEQRLEMVTASAHYWLSRDLRGEFNMLVRDALDAPGVQKWESLAYIRAFITFQVSLWALWPRQFRIDAIPVGRAKVRETLSELKRALDRVFLTGDPITIAEYLLIIAHTAYRNESYEESREFNQRALEYMEKTGQGPLTRALFERGEIEFALRNFEAARTYFRRSAELKENGVATVSAHALLGIARCNLAVGNVKDGLRGLVEASEVIRLYSDAAWTLHDIAALYAQHGYPDDAYQCLREALARNPHDPDTALCTTSLPFHLANVAIAQGDAAVAEVLFTAAETLMKNARDLKMYQPLHDRIDAGLAGNWTYSVEKADAEAALNRLGKLLLSEASISLKSAVIQVFVESEGSVS